MTYSLYPVCWKSVALLPTLEKRNDDLRRSGIEAHEVELTVEAGLESGQAFRLEALGIEKPDETHYTARCYNLQVLAPPMPEVRTSTPQEAIRTALCHLAAQKE